MQQLFVKIFLWFWLAITLVGAILVVLTLTTNERGANIARLTRHFTSYGSQLIKILEEKGRQSLVTELLRLQEKEHVQIILYHPETEPISAQPLSPGLKRFLEESPPADTPQLNRNRPRDGRIKKHIVVPLNNGYKLVVDARRPSTLERLLDPRALTLRLVVTFLVAGIVCYLLARSLTAPLSKLRKASQAIADGDLTTRVTPLLGKQSKEITSLARDFDQMAERVETLFFLQQQLLRDISHELRSPLARLNVALELARQQENNTAKAPLDRIEKESGRLNELIGQLLTLAQLESRKNILGTEPIELTLFLKKIVQDANYEAQNRNCSIYLVASLDFLLNGSPELLHRAFENVIRNALRFTAEGSQVKINVNTYNDDGNYVRITVRDHGSGVPEKDLTSLFRPFYRGGDARDRTSGGVGVGLAIAERSIQLHGGTITATNVSGGGGLIVTIMLPCQGSNGVCHSH
jgi:two-component system sensor histidine kinase CpxA